MNTYKLTLLCFLGLFISFSCTNKVAKEGHSQNTGMNINKLAWSKGNCFDKTLSPYTYQIATVEGDEIYYYKVGVMGKEILKGSLASLKSGDDPFKVTPCP